MLERACACVVFACANARVANNDALAHKTAMGRPARSIETNDKHSSIGSGNAG